jgi:hypothetical protein
MQFYKVRSCPGSSVAEHFLGKEEVGGSIPLLGSSQQYGQKCFYIILVSKKWSQKHFCPYIGYGV